MGASFRLRSFCRDSAPFATSWDSSFVDEVLTSFARTGKMFCVEHSGVVPDVMTVGKGFGNGFPVTGLLVREDLAVNLEKISASTSYGGNDCVRGGLGFHRGCEEEGLGGTFRASGYVSSGAFARNQDGIPLSARSRPGLSFRDGTGQGPKNPRALPGGGEKGLSKAFARGLAWILPDKTCGCHRPGDVEGGGG